MSAPFVTVITTIQPPTPSVGRLMEHLARTGGELIVVGDKKGPDHFDVPGARFVPLAEQMQLPFGLARLLPTGHYVRKNLGYLLAFAGGAERIYETDDDNGPMGHWGVRDLTVDALPVTEKGWLNVYRFFADREQVIWPRGFPLRYARQHVGSPAGAAIRVESPIQQELSDVAPDVDAVWRLTIGAEPFRFAADRPSVHLAPGVWCPFNSQATWWFKAAFPLMYLPSTCTFRMTDIWRSLVAQRCLWELEQGVTFHRASVEQARNAHDLMRDFEDEVPGYLKNERIAEVLSGLGLRSEPGAVTDNLIKCYDALVVEGTFAPQELTLVRAWVADIDKLR